MDGAEINCEMGRRIGAAASDSHVSYGHNHCTVTKRQWLLIKTQSLQQHLNLDGSWLLYFALWRYWKQTCLCIIFISGYIFNSFFLG